jgi:hypothetical protein
MDKLAILAAGLLFGVGVTVSGMVDPMKVQNFMDLFGIWDPTLLFVMGGGLAVAFAGYRVVLARQRPWFAPAFNLPAARAIDAPLIGGAAVFGLGWGISGFCPGPAVASLVFGRVESVIFVVAMVAGMLASRFLARPPAQAEPTAVEG